MKNLKGNMPKVLSAILSITILCSSVGMTAYSVGTKSAETASTKTEETTSDTTTTNSDGDEVTKEETVYVIADAEGNAKKIIVSDWIKNTEGLDTINDVSDLNNIENLKGDETYTMDKDNMCVWDAEGNDIYYQGTSDKDIPVDLAVSYKLNGKTVSPDELAGKSGKVTMHFEYTNNQYEMVKIDGKKEKIYVPFAMITGMILDNDNFKNVEVSNGKIINDGNRTIVAGFAFPGLQESIDVESDDLDIPTSFDVTADVTDFKLTTTMTIATNDVFSDIDFSTADDKMDEVNDELDELTTATDKLIDGSSTLYNGLETLLNKSGDLISGVKSLASGAKKLNSGANELNSGAKKLDKGAVSLDSGAGQLKSGITELSKGLTTLSSNSATLNNGAKKVFDTLLSTADSQIAAAGIEAEKLTISNYSTVLTNVAKNLTEENIKALATNTAKQTVTAAVKAQESYITSQVEEAVKSQVLSSVLQAVGLSMTAEDYNKAVEAGQIPEETQSQITAVVTEKMATDEIQEKIKTTTEEKINELIEQNMQSDDVQTQINAAVEKGKAGSTAITELKEQLDSYNQFYQGVLTYTKGVDTAKTGSDKLVAGAKSLKKGTKTLKSGTKSLKKGTKTLAKGTKTLDSGVNKLLEGSEALVSGVTKLKDGSMTLTNGLKQYKKEGVQKLVDVVNGDVKGLLNRFKTISKVSADYKSYSGISDSMNGKVDFIYKTDSIEE